MAGGGGGAFLFCYGSISSALFHPEFLVVVDMREHNNIHAPITIAPFCGCIAGERMVFRITSSRQTGRNHVAGFNKELRQLRGARGGKLPVGLILTIMDRDIVGVSFDANVVGRDGQGAADREQRVSGSWNRY